MPYGNVTARLVGRKFLVEIEVPGNRELFLSGRAENLVYQLPWVSLEGSDLRRKSTVCLPTVGRRRLR